MKILGICGSPRRGGNTETLLDKAFEGAASKGAECEKIILSDLDISPCREEEYEEVNDKGLSVIDDDMQLIFRKIEEADCLVLASPIFFGSLSAQTKMMIDRFQCVWIAKNLKGMDVFTREKKGAFLSVEASTRQDFFDNAKSIVRHFFAVINVRYKKELFCPGAERKEDMSKRPACLEEAFKFGEELASQE
ncbi:MAG: flavodoxin family protein [Candidatus Omnitrophota bacterium]